MSALRRLLFAAAAVGCCSGNSYVGIVERTRLSAPAKTNHSETDPFKNWTRFFKGLSSNVSHAVDKLATVGNLSVTRWQNWTTHLIENVTEEVTVAEQGAKTFFGSIGKSQPQVKSDRPSTATDNDGNSTATASDGNSTATASDGNSTATDNDGKAVISAKKLGNLDSSRRRKSIQKSLGGGPQSSGIDLKVLLLVGIPSLSCLLISALVIICCCSKPKDDAREPTYSKSRSTEAESLADDGGRE